MRKCRKIAVLLLLAVFLLAGFSDISTQAAQKPGTPVLKSAVSKSYNSVKLSWKKVSGADGYYVYHKTSGDSWKRISDITSGDTVSYTDTGLTCGTEYTYTVKAYFVKNKKKVFGSYSKKGITCTPVPAKPALESVTKKSSDSVSIKWKKVSGANGYYVYRKVPDGSWKRVKDITSGSTVSCTDKELEPGETYIFTVKAYRKADGKNICGSYDRDGLQITLPLSAVSISLSESSDTRIRVSWESCSNAQAYQVWRSVTKSSGYTKVKTTEDLSFTDSGLTRGMTYYYKVRAYKKKGDTVIYGEWGSVKSLSLPEMYDSEKNIKPLSDGTNIYIVGDSTTRNYASNGVFNNGSVYSHGAWGEYLQDFFNSEKIQVNDYGASGRSSRSFINEGYLTKVKKTIKEGDYLFIQFGHNDRKASSDRVYTPLGTADENGVYPVKAGRRSATPDEYKSTCGDRWYSSESGTFKWYLYRYVSVALNAGATPVLVTPVSRLYFNSSGKIRPHHDDSGLPDSERSNAYVEAVKQVYEEFRKKGAEIYLLDMFGATKKLYETAYKNDSGASGKSSPLAAQLFDTDDTIHSSKLGGFVQAAQMAAEIKDSGMELADRIKIPKNVTSVASDNKTVTVTVNHLSEVSGYALTLSGDKYTAKKSDYWTSVVQKLIDSLR
ncbi:MAG: fibronectin type III domain-containing protein [Lachnospiraceae bacterium]|nr:fibronectin type III domain-containing protein [Lachnospiraceae bacterium]